VRTYVRQVFVDAITEKYGMPDIVAGVATGGIAIGALIAEQMGLPFIYVRSSAKAHGMQNQIEGAYEKGQNVVVIEDLISTGGSSIKAIEALREGGLEIKGLAAIFTYGFDVAIKNFKNADCDFITLSNYDLLIEQAISENYVTAGDAKSLADWKTNPENWNK
jgi:orotate phosphoribosyltransferase